MFSATLHVLDSFTKYVKMPTKVFFFFPRATQENATNELTACVAVATPSACK